MKTNTILQVLKNRLNILRKDYAKNLELVKETFDDEAIHDLRVSMRRIQAFLSFIDEICEENVSAGLINLVKAKIKRFNRLRDAQVQIQFIIKNLKKFPETLDFLVYLKQRENKQIKKIKILTKLSEFDLSGDLFYYQMKLPYIQCLKHIDLRQIVENAQNSLVQVKLSINNIEKGNYQTYHKTRLLIKKFRYIIETIEEIINSPKEKLKEIQQIQTILGEIQDFTVLLELIDNFCTKESVEVTKFLNFVEFIKQKRLEKEEEFWKNINIIEFWDNFFVNFA